MNYSSFSRVIEDYKVVMLDSYGVVKNHKGLIDGVQESIRTLKQKGKTFRLLTNDASRSQEQQLESLQRLGLHDIELHAFHIFHMLRCMRYIHYILHMHCIPYMCYMYYHTLHT